MCISLSIINKRGNSTMQYNKLLEQAHKLALKAKPWILKYDDSTYTAVYSMSQSVYEVFKDGEVTDFTYGPYRALNDWWWCNEGWKYFVPHSVYSRLQEAEKKRKKRV